MEELANSGGRSWHPCRARKGLRDAVVIDTLLTLLPGWKGVASTAVGAFGSGRDKHDPHAVVAADCKPRQRAEHLGFLFRCSAVCEMEPSSLASDPVHAFECAPFVGHFQVLKELSSSHSSSSSSSLPTLTTGSSDVYRQLAAAFPLQLTLVNVASRPKPQERLVETRAIAALARDLYTQLGDDGTAERKIVVLGSFHLTPDEIADASAGNARSDHNSLNDSGLRSSIPFLAPSVSSTVFGDLADNLCMHAAELETTQFAYHIESGVFRFDLVYYPHTRGVTTEQQQQQGEGRAVSGTTRSPQQHPMARVQCANEFSEHCPVRLALW